MPIILRWTKNLQAHFQGKHGLYNRVEWFDSIMCLLCFYVNTCPRHDIKLSNFMVRKGVNLLTDKERQDYMTFLQATVELYYQQYIEKRNHVEGLCLLCGLTEEEKQFVFKNVK